MMHDGNVRTTLTIDPDVAARLQRELASGRTTLKQVVNERLRIGFGLQEGDAMPEFRVKAHASTYRSGVDPLRFNQLVDDLEAEALVGKPVE